ncbi:MAG: hypothetical protein PHH77_12740 [Victivallaceae bacterium]|nr:hypothetical protein [Victivallaceae bacterium]
MVYENEVIMFLLCVGVFIFTVNKRREYNRIPHGRLLMGAFYVFFGAVICTVAEGFFWPVLLNTLEHLGYLGSSLLMLIWCRTIFSGIGGGK